MTDSGKRTRAPRESRQRDAYDDFLDGVEWLEGREDAASSRAGSAAPKRGRAQGAKPAGESGTERRAPAAKAASRTASRDGVQAAAAPKHAGALLDGKRGAAQSGAQAGGKSAAIHAGAGARSASNAQATVRAGAGKDGTAQRSSEKARKKPPAAAEGGASGAKAARQGTAQSGGASAEHGAPAGGKRARAAASSTGRKAVRRVAKPQAADLLAAWSELAGAGGEAVVAAPAIGRRSTGASRRTLADKASTAGSQPGSTGCRFDGCTPTGFSACVRNGGRSGLPCGRAVRANRAPAAPGTGRRADGKL